MKLSGRPKERPARRPRTLSSARSERKQPTHHGPLQRLLGASIVCLVIRIEHPLKPQLTYSPSAWSSKGSRKGAVNVLPLVVWASKGGWWLHAQANSRWRKATENGRYTSFRTLLVLKGIGANYESSAHRHSAAVIVCAARGQCADRGLLGFFAANARRKRNHGSQPESCKRQGATHAGT